MERRNVTMAWIVLAVFLVGCLTITAFADDKKTIRGKTVNVNKASAEEMVKNIPILTPELARKIVDYRKKNGDFQTLEELLQVEGVTRDLLRKLKKFFILEGIGGKDCTC